MRCALHKRPNKKYKLPSDSSRRRTPHARNAFVRTPGPLDMPINPPEPHVDRGYVVEPSYFVAWNGERGEWEDGYEQHAAARPDRLESEGWHQDQDAALAVEHQRIRSIAEAMGA